MVLPLLLAVAAALLWLLTVGLAQLRVTDAAREAARAMARGEDAAVATGLVAGIAPEGATVDADESAGTVTVTVAAVLAGPGGLLSHLPGAQLRAEATAVVEDTGAVAGTVVGTAP
ncbi:pilus assembly protein [Nocardioides sp. GY 10127]|nr:pilus assembly protein [Nocardioides sp. GY 10127]